MTNRHHAVVCAIVMGIVFSACGTAADDGTPAGVTKAQYIKRADAICGRASKRQEQLYRQLAKTQISRPKFVERGIVAPLESELAQLKELPPPVSDGASAKQYLRALASGLEQLKANPTSLFRGEGMFLPANELAAHFGFEVCRGA